MKISKDKSILLSRCCIVLFAAALLALDGGGYFAARWFCAVRSLDRAALYAMTAAIYLCSVFAWIALWQLWRLLGNLRREAVFTAENVRRLRIVSWCCVGVAAVCFAACFFYLPFLFVAIAAGFMALIVRIIKNVFEQAIEMKSELDLTI